MRANYFYLLVLLFLFGVYANEKIKFQQNFVNFTSASDLRWINEDVAFVITSDIPRVLLRTADGGITWKDLTSKLHESLPKGVYAQPEFIYHHEVEDKKVYIRGNGSHVWFSHDAGETWKTYKPGEGFRNLDWHPRIVGWAISTKSRFDDFRPVNDLYVTLNYGESWKLVAENIGRYAWGDAGTGVVPDSRIFFIRYEREKLPFFVQTDNYGDTISVIQDGAVDFLFLSRQLLVLVASRSSFDVRLKVSPNIGFNYRQFFAAEFPFGEDLPQNGFSILDDSTGSIYLGINHQNALSRWGNVYSSNSFGNRYVISQQHVSHLNGAYDFDKMEGLDGIYVVNLNAGWDDEQSALNLQTYMTMNNGRSWSTVQHPRFDVDGDPIDCEAPCSLHLHGWTGFTSTSIGRFYSTPKAIGHILANGNVGKQLAHETSEINTYFSRDGGKSWKEVMKGPSTYEFGDHGSIIAIAPLSVATNKIYYTLDEATTPLKELVIADKEFTITNIVTEPNSTNERFIVVGKRGSQGILVGVDFTKVYDRICKSEDYELWNPQGPEGPCLLGRKVVYRRRKPTAQCFNDETVDHVVSSTPCPCTEEDWECDLEYERKTPDGPCELVGKAHSYPPVICPEGYTYNKTSGYRPLPGTYCKNGIQRWGEGPFKCPKTSSPSTGWIAAVILIPIVLVLSFVAFGCFAMRNETLREKLPFLKTLAGTRIGYFGLRMGPGTMDDDDDLFEHMDDEESIVPQPLGLDDDESDFNPRG